jgi:hypothetical protein
LSPKVVIGNGTMAMVATDDGDRFVKAGSVLTVAGQQLRVNAISGGRSAWSVDASAA